MTDNWRLYYCNVQSISLFFNQRYTLSSQCKSTNEQLYTVMENGNQDRNEQ